MCIATATSSHGAPRKSSPRHDGGAKPIECRTPSTHPHLVATASRTESTCAGCVTSSSNTSMPSPSLRAVRCVRLSARPAPVSTISAPSWSAIRATPYASDASVSTPVMTIFFPSSSPMPSKVAASRLCKALRMRIGVIGGTGPAGSALAARLASVGYAAMIGSRSKYRAMESRDELIGQFPELAELLTYGDNAAAADCELVIIATPWDSAATMAQSHGKLLRGKVVVSMANALVRVGSEFEPLIPPRGSVAAHVQAAVPSSRVVAAFHHLPAKELGLIGEPIDSDVLICGDDPDAVSTVSEIAAKIPGCRPLDAGELSNATAIEAFTAVLLQLNVRYKTRVAPKLTGIRRDPREMAVATPETERRDPDTG